MGLSFDRADERGSAVFWIVFALAILAGGYFLFVIGSRREEVPPEMAEISKEKPSDLPDESGLSHSQMADNLKVPVQDRVAAEPEDSAKGLAMAENDEHKEIAADNMEKSSKEESVTLSKHRLVSNRDKFYLWIEAEDADLIEPSFEIGYDEQCSGVKFLSHPEDTGSAWAKNKENGIEIPCGVGRADYRIDIPAAGDWYFWGRVKWETGCSDCFDVFIDDNKPRRRNDVFIANKFNDEMFGKDNTLETWHWISSQYFSLEAGQHMLSLRNHDDGSHLDRILLTNDASFRPQGLGDCHIRFGDDFSERIHKGENFYLAWLIDMKIERGKWLAKKDRLYPDDKDADMRALILDGEDWWKDYQFTFLLDPPASGRAGAVFYYKDEKNFYELAFLDGNIELVKNFEGVTTTLDKKALPPESAERKLRKANNQRQMRATINRFKEKILVYIDGVKIFDLKEESLHTGRAGFFSEWSKGFAIDDYEISSLEFVPDRAKNERIEWFCKRKARVFNSVLDSFGATGGFHPGDYKDRRQELNLAMLQKNISGIAPANEAKLLDWQWLTFDKDVFREKYGLSKGAGYLIGRSPDKDKERFLWTPNILSGDWDFEFKIIEELSDLKIHICEADGKKPKLWFKTIDIGEILKRAQEEKNKSWTKFALCKRSDKGVIKINGRQLDEITDLPDKDFRIGFSIKGGTFFLDTISAGFYPSLYYDFRYNTPWSLALSDWDMDKVKKLRHGGGYYNFLILSTEKDEKRKFAKIASKRLFRGDFAALLEIDLENSQDGEEFRSFSLALTDDKGVDERIVLSRNNIIKKARIKSEEIGKLKNFSSEMRRMTQLFFVIRSGKGILYLNDDEGTMRPIDCGNFLNSRAPFKFSLIAEPELRISKILIWGQDF